MTRGNFNTHLSVTCYYLLVGTSDGVAGCGGRRVCYCENALVISCHNDFPSILVDGNRFDITSISTLP